MAHLNQDDLHHNRVIRSFQLFFAKTTAGGIVLIVATAIAMIWANSMFHDSYHHLWNTKISVFLGDLELFPSHGTHPFNIHMVINDALMVVFFFLVGLEIKRELLIGELSSFKKAMLPVIGAVGGVVGPVLIYVALNSADPAAMKGWAVPMATDIAFSLGILALAGDKVPLGIKVFLAALAIVDDLMAVLVIAIFYTDHVSLGWLAWGGLFAAVMYILNKLKINNPWAYFVISLGLWYAFLQSGVHATIAGVVGAFLIPSESLIDRKSFFERTNDLWDRFKNYYEKNKSHHMNENEEDTISMIERGLEKVQSPLHRLEHGLTPYVAFIIMPIFALANAGVYFGNVTIDMLLNTVTIGIVLGLFFGKIIGISAAVWIAVKVGLANLPRGTNFKQMVAVSILCAIGFTMALFVSGLSFEPGSDFETYSKLGILIASTIAAVIGIIVLLNVIDNDEDEDSENKGNESDDESRPQVKMI